MSIHGRTYAGDVDLPRIAELILASPATSPHRVDFPWRLSSPALQSPLDARVWEDDWGSRVGFAAWQSPWATLDYFVRPGLRQREVEDAIFTWAERRFRELDEKRGRPLPYWVEAREDDVARRDVLARHGYDLDDDYGYVVSKRSLVEPLPDPTLPAGFRIRPLAGPAEVDAYVALHRAAFSSTSMTADWRARTLRSPEYAPDLDLVAVAPNGDLAGFCVCWLHEGAVAGQIEPIGVHPRFQRRGLARALLATCFRRLKDHGADEVMVETETTRAEARRTYESVGFRVDHQVIRKGRWMESPRSEP